MISVANGIMENAVNRFIEMSAIPENEQDLRQSQDMEKNIKINRMDRKKI